MKSLWSHKKLWSGLILKMKSLVTLSQKPYIQKSYNWYCIKLWEALTRVDINDGTCCLRDQRNFVDLLELTITRCKMTKYCQSILNIYYLCYIIWVQCHLNLTFEFNPIAFRKAINLWSFGSFEWVQMVKH